MNLTWITGLASKVKDALTTVEHHIAPALQKVIAKTGSEAHALVNHLGHFAVVTAEDLKNGIDHLYEAGFHHVATATPTAGAQPAVNDNTLAELMQRMRALEDMNARLLQQRDAAVAQVQQATPPAPPAPTPVQVDPATLAPTALTPPVNRIPGT